MTYNQRETIMTQTKTQSTDERIISADANMHTATQRSQESIGTATTSMIDGIMTLNREIIDFVSERIRQDIETQQEFRGCRSLDAIGSVQMKFLRTAVDQYSAEADKLAKLGAEIVQRSLNRGA